MDSMNKALVLGAENKAQTGNSAGDLSFVCDVKDLHLIGRITERGVKMAASQGVTIDYMTCQMDITACHCNDTPLKLLSFLMSDNADFIHDFCGIGNNIDRHNGKLINGFKPMFAEKPVQ